MTLCVVSCLQVTKIATLGLDLRYQHSAQSNDEE